MKLTFTIVSGILMLNAAIAQQAIKTYFLTNSGKIVSAKDSAEYFLQIFPPDTSVDKNLFVVKEFYKGGSIRLIGNAKSNTLKGLNFQGPQVIYFSNGHKLRITQFKNGEPIGDVVEYYPNGKLYDIKSYSPDGKVFLKQCNDSTGNVIAENGIGKWIEYNESFNEIYSEGTVDNGIQDGVWKIKLNDSTNFVREFKAGQLISNETAYKREPTGKIFTSVESMPRCPKSFEAFYRFLGTNIRYPAKAFENGTQGTVIVQFLIERDGTLNNIKVTRGIGDGCDEEAIRVIKLSPLWIPGMQRGVPVRCVYSMPISFKLDK